MTPETISKIAHWRAKQREGELSQADMLEIIRTLRGERVGAAMASAKTKVAKAKAEIPNANDLLDELGAI